MVKKKNLFIRDLSIFLTKDTVGSKYRILIVTINHNRREQVKKNVLSNRSPLPPVSTKETNFFNSSHFISH